MTAMNAWATPHAAYLLTDTAWYNPDGSILEFGPKVVEHMLAPAAFAFTGRGLHPGKLAGQISINTLNPMALIKRLPDLLRDHLEWADRTEPGVRHRFGVVAAIYNLDTGPEVWRCDTCHDWGAPETFVAFNLASAMNSRTVGGKDWGVSEMLGRPVNMADERSFDPERDGRALIEMQRTLKAPLDTGGEGHIVGGSAVLTRVDMSGIRHKVLAQWPDRAGEPIRA